MKVRREQAFSIEVMIFITRTKKKTLFRGGRKMKKENTFSSLKLSDVNSSERRVSPRHIRM